MALIERRAADLQAGDVIFDTLSGKRIGQLVEDPIRGFGPWVSFLTDSPTCLGVLLNSPPELVYVPGVRRCYGNEYAFNVIPWSQ